MGVWIVEPVEDMVGELRLVARAMGRKTPDLGMEGVKYRILGVKVSFRDIVGDRGMLRHSPFGITIILTSRRPLFA